MSDDVLYYPKGRIAVGTGDLMQVQDFSAEIKNGGKLVHTLRRSPSGVTQGLKEANVSFNAVLDEKGPERDYWTSVLSTVVKQMRGKFPGLTLTFNGIFTETKLDVSMEDAIKYSTSFTGNVTITPI